MSEKPKLKKDLILEVAQLQGRLEELETALPDQQQLEKESQWRLLAESSPDHILTLALDLTIEYANHPSPGLPIDDLIGVPIISFLDDERQEEIKSILRGVIKTGQAALYETEYPSPDGGIIYYETHAIPRKSGGKVMGLTLNSRDCSKRIKAEFELKESEEKYRALYDNAPQPYQSLDEEGRFLDINPAWLRTLGYERSQIIGKKFADLLHPDWKSNFERKFPVFKEKGYVSDVQYKIKHKDGHYLHISFEGCVGYTPKGKFKQTYCVFQDISERVRSEEELRLQENRIQSIFRSAPIGIGLVKNRTILEVNKHLCQMTGYTEDELLDQNARILYPTEEDYEFVGREKYNQIEEYGVGTVETRFLRKNGDVIDVILSSSPIDVNNLDKGVTFSAQDISERKQTERQYKDLVEKAGIAILLDDQKGNFTYFNSYFLELFGYQEEEIQSKNIRDLVHPDDLEFVLDQHQKRLDKQPDLQRYEFRGLRKDGTIINLEVDVILLEKNNMSIGTRSYLWDITERKELEAVLLRERFNLENVLGTMKDGVYVVDQQFNIEYLNPVLESEFGPYEGHKCYAYFHDREDVCPWCKNEEVFAGKTVHWEFFLAKNQKTYDLIDTPLKNPDGSISKLEIFRDITDRKRVEQELEDVFDLSPDMVGVFTTEGKLLKVNPAWEKILGYKQNELLDSGWTELVHPDDVEETTKTVEKQLEGSSVVNFVNRYKHKDGSYKTLEWQATYAKEGIVHATARDVTEYRKREEKLRKSEEKYRQLVDLAQEGIWVIDNDSRTTFVNPSMGEMLGYSTDEMIGKHLFSFMDDSGIEIATRNVERRKQGITEQHDFEFIRKDGARIYVTLETAPIVDEDGNYNGSIAGMIDITKRKQAELAVQTAANEWEITFDSVTDALMVLDNDQRIIRTNRAMTEMFPDYTDPMIGKYCFEIVHGIQEPIEECPTIRMQRSLERESIELNVDDRILEVIVDPILDESGDLSGAVHSIRDITERKQMVGALQKSEEKFRKYVETSQDLIWECDAEGKFIYLNPVWEEVTGYKLNEMLGKPFTEFTIQEEVEKNSAEFAKHLEGGFVKNFPSTYISKKGSKISLNFNAIPLLDSKKNIIGTQGSAHDITERKNAEDKLLKNQYYLTKAQEMGMIGTWELDIQNDILSWTEENYKIFGVPSGTEMNLELFLNCIHPDDREYVAEKWDAALENEPYDINHRIILNDEVRWVREKADVEFDKDGNPVLAIGFSQDITERKQVEQRLAKERALLKAIIENIPVLLTQYDPDTNMLFLNKMFEKTIGWSTEEVKGIDMMAEVYPDPDYRKQAMDYMLEASTEWREFKVHSKSGKIIDSEWSNIRLDDGTQIGIGIDITERKLAEQSLRESEEKFRNYVETSQDLIWESDSEGRFTYLNPAWEGVTGYKMSEMLGKPFTDFTVQEEVERNSVEFAKHLEGGFVKNYPSTYISKEGSKISLNFNAIPLLDSKKNIIGTQGSAHDITERKRTEQALAHSHDLMTYIIEHSRSSIAVHDTDLKYIYVSNRYLDEYNLKDPNIIGKHHYDVFPDLPQKWRDVHQKALAGEISSAENDPYYRDDGSVEWTRWECRPWYEGDGTIGGIIVYTEVITDRILAEQEKDILLEQVQIANDRLQALSRELINSQEEERKRISQELHDDLGQALTAITLDLNIIERELGPDIPLTIRNRISETKAIADELDQKIGELALDLRPSLLDDIGLMSALSWYLDRWSQRAEVEVEIKSSGKKKRLPPEIEIAIYRIVQEALTNVAKHAEAKNVVLHINQQKKSVILKIEDDGRGFDYNEFQNQQAPPQGLGLLGMIDRISLLGGDCEVHSNIGEGTRIEIEIPL